MRKLFEIGGVVATAVLIIFGVVAIVMGVNGRNTVQDSLKLEQIVGPPERPARRDAQGVTRREEPPVFPRPSACACRRAPYRARARGGRPR